MAVEEVITKIYRCDLCQIELEEEGQLMQGLSFPVLFTTEQTEGRPVKPYITRDTFDLCEQCLDEAVTITGSGAQGYNRYYLRSKGGRT